VDFPWNSAHFPGTNGHRSRQDGAFLLILRACRHQVDSALKLRLAFALSTTRRSPPAITAGGVHRPRFPAPPQGRRDAGIPQQVTRKTITMKKTAFAVQELESRFELETYVLDDGTEIDTSTLGDSELARAVDSTCTSTCKPK